MAEHRIFVVPEPLPEATLRLPGNAGTVKVKVKKIELASSGEYRVLVDMPCWERWRTQLRPGQPAEEGVSPCTLPVWAPSSAVWGDPEVVLALRAKSRLQLERVG